MNLYSNIEQAIRQHEDTIRVDDNAMESDVRHAIRWVMRDNPDIFWFVHQYHFDQERKTISFRYQFSKERSELIQKSIENVVENDFQIEYVRSLGVYEQVMYVCKWLLTYCNYNVNSAYNQNIDSVFVRRNSVCTGYAKAAQYLFKSLDIESKLVFGRLNNDRKDGRHCWNMVYIEGTYYHLDVCLGDTVLEDTLIKAGVTEPLRYGDFNYNCFCVSTDEIARSRSIEDADSLPICDRSLEEERIESLSLIPIKQRNSAVGCLLSHIGSSADIYLCTKDKNVVLKKFRGNDSRKCDEEYGFIDDLRGCNHLLQLNDAYSDVRNNILSIEQSTPLVDLFCSHYYHPTLNGVLAMIKDIILGWLECRGRGILYRDIHVCNIYKANDGQYKLGDFGSCAYERRGLYERVGNQWFMSPEAYINGHFDERSAVYSITAVLYFILNGLHPPFVDGHNEEEALQRKMNGVALPEPLLLRSFPKAVAEMIMNRLITKGCAFYPSERIRSCNELLHIIDRILACLKEQRIKLSFVQQDTEKILADKTVSNVYIPRDIHHRFAYGEEVERIAISRKWSPDSEGVEMTATTVAATIIDVDGNGSFEEEVGWDDINNNGSFEEEEVIWDDLLDELRTTLEGDDADVSSIPMSDDVENYCRTMGGGERLDRSTPPTDNKNNSASDPNSINTKLAFDYTPRPKGMYKTGAAIGSAIGSVFSPIGIVLGGISGWFSGKSNNTEEYDEVYSSIFASSEVKPKTHMLVQVYLHLFGETEKVKTLAQESDKNAERRDYIPLQCKLKKGDSVDVQFSIFGKTLLMSDKKGVIWQGSFTKCSFDYFVPKDIDVDELSCVAMLTVNGVPVGEMRFITKIVESPRQLNPEIFAHKYNKVFISYAHKDEAKVKSFHEGLKLAGIEHFFDRTYLKAGDIFPQVIQSYINSADLFVLFWSENASKSDYVEKERKQALERAFPQVKPQQDAKLSIYPMSIEPHAELPNDMKDNYHFGEI